jgi:predicted nucleic acid-binding protein
MTTAVDSNILIDVIGTASDYSNTSINALDHALLNGALIICPVVASEIASHYKTQNDLASNLRAMQISIVQFTTINLHAAGVAYAQYQSRSQSPKPRMLADFLIGAHALEHADLLLTRDRGYYRTYFPKLRLSGT